MYFLCGNIYNTKTPMNLNLFETQQAIPEFFLSSKNREKDYSKIPTMKKMGTFNNNKKTQKNHIPGGEISRRQQKKGWGLGGLGGEFKF